MALTVPQNQKLSKSDLLVTTLTADAAALFGLIKYAEAPVWMITAALAALNVGNLFAVAVHLALSSLTAQSTAGHKSAI